jgi:hypothetical protein
MRAWYTTGSISVGSDSGEFMFSSFLVTEQREQGEQQEFPPHFHLQNSSLEQLPQVFSFNHVFCSGVSFLASVIS